MTISKKSWHWKVYLAWFKSKTKNGYHRCPEDVKVVNLCPYMRVVLFWALPRWAFLGDSISRRVVSWLLVYASFLATIGLFSGTRAFWAALGVTASVALCIVGTFTMAFGIARWCDLPKPKKPPSKFLTLVKAWIKAKHKKICPLIEITD
jgi:hypothetical protein